MRSPLRKTASAALLAALALAALPAAAAAEAVAPLPESEYAFEPACGAPMPGHGSCFAEQLVPLSGRAKQRRHPIGGVRNLSSSAQTGKPSLNSGVFGLRPQDIHTAYELPVSASAVQTIAFVDAYNDPTAEEDLKTYSKEFGLPACTTANNCFQKVGETGSSATSGLPFPKTTAELESFLAGNKEEKEEAEEAIGWGVEISLDIESAHATCQNCKLILVESGELSGRTLFGPMAFSHLEAAERRAEAMGAQEISNSWGGPETGITSSEEAAGPFNHPGTVITASAGDAGYRDWQEGKLFTSYPSSSPHVVAVGGTRLLLNEGRRSSESVWNGDGASGGGCSKQFAAPSWQSSVSDWSLTGCANRLDNDVSADADPYTGVVIRDTDHPGRSCEAEYEEAGVIKTEKNWCTYGGTSLASPIVAATFALAGGADGASYPASTLYANLRNAPRTFHDVTSGSNGECLAGYDEFTGLSNCSASEEASRSCGGRLECMAAAGYDGPSGVGSPNGILGFVPGQYEAQAQETPAATVIARPAQAPASPAVVPVAPLAPKSVELSGLGLTTTSVIALDRKPVAGKVAFHFNSNLPARVTVTLARRVRSHHRLRWVAVNGARRIWASVGHNLSRLTGSKRLPRGAYRLTLAPSGGKSRSILFHIG
jgi:hypothetical protein